MKGKEKAFRVRLALPAVFLLGVLAASCGGGGGSSSNPVTGGAIKGTISVPDATGRQAARLLGGAAVTLTTSSGATSTTTSNATTGAFQFSNVPVGNLHRVSAVLGSIEAVMYFNVDEVGQTVSKNMTEVTTAAAIAVDRLKARGEGDKAGDPDEMEQSPLLGDLIAALTAAYKSGSGFDFDALLTGPEADAILDLISQGASLDDIEGPTIAMTYPAPGATMLDTVVLANGFKISFSYSDDTIPDPDGEGFSVTIQIDGGNPVSLTSHFDPTSNAKSFSLASDAQLYQSLNGVIPLDVITTHQAALNVTIRDICGNESAYSGATAFKFTVNPDVPSPPE